VLLIVNESRYLPSLGKTLQPATCRAHIEVN